MISQLGRDNKHPFAYHQETNRNGHFLEDFAVENDLVCLNTKFQKLKLWTYTYANGMEAQLDYMFVKKKLINSIVNSEAYNTFEGVTSTIGLCRQNIISVYMPIK